MTLNTSHVAGDPNHPSEHNALATQVNTNTSDIATNTANIALAETAAHASATYETQTHASATYVAAQIVGAPNGTTDGTAINAKINAASAAGGGDVILDAGTYTADVTIIVKTGVRLIGRGRGATVIQAKSGLASDVVQTLNFATLTGTNPTAAPWGESQFAIKHLTVDGTGQTAGNCVSIYGYDYDVDGLVCRNGFAKGFYSEWSSTGNIPSPDGPAARLGRVKAHNNGDHGFHFNGPQSSYVGEVLAYQNGSGKTGILLDTKAPGLQAAKVHSWGTNHAYALRLLGVGQLVDNAALEGASTAQLLFGGQYGRVRGRLFSGGTAGLTGIAFAVGNAQCRFDGLIDDLATAVNYTNDWESDLRFTSATNTALYSGTPQAGSRAEIHDPINGLTTTLRGSAVIKDGAWTTYTPTLTATTTNPTLGTGSIANGWYKRLDNKTVIVKVLIVFGSGMTPGSGTYDISMPFARAQNDPSGLSGMIQEATGTHNRIVSALAASASNTTVRLMASASGDAVTVSDSQPWVWAANDFISFTYIYETT
jgi:hypothetical protein